jgi:hypothetical protein
MAWQPSPAGQTVCAARYNARASSARRHGNHMQTAHGMAVARWRKGVAGDLERTTGKVPGDKERAGAHRNGGSTLRRRKRRRAAVFNAGWVAPVVVDVRGGVLQHRCGRGKRDLAPIWE